MIKLHSRLPMTSNDEPFVVRVVTRESADASLRDREAFVCAAGMPIPKGYQAYFAPCDSETAQRGEAWPLPRELQYLSDGDIVRVSPRTGEIWVMYRKNAPTNSLLLTERCNSNCVMCSQPPKAGDDSHLVDAYLTAIPLMSAETRELGLTGGEPTLLGESLLQVIRCCKECLPHTSLHMLSNGRMFNYVSLCRALAEIDHPDLMVGIPLYSDLSYVHDYVVQVPGAYDQTLRGIINLARAGIAVEIRMVLHRATVDRLPEFATFVARNLPFVSHVALMGLELMGHVRMNMDALWIDPCEYQSTLDDAVEILARNGMNVSIYNHQLCVLDRRMWPYARKSISDWKNEYIDVCDRCSVRDQCGGFFSSSVIRKSERIHAITEDDLARTESGSGFL